MGGQHQGWGSFCYQFPNILNFLGFNFIKPGANRATGIGVPEQVLAQELCYRPGLRKYRHCTGNFYSINKLME